MSRNLWRWLAIALLGLLLVSCAGWVSPPANQAAPSTAEISLESLLPEPSSTATWTVTAAPPTETPDAASTPTPTDTIEAFPTSFIAGPDKFPPEINALTGLVAADPQLLRRRPILVKVTNYPRSVRPQWGLTFADHVIEYYIADEFTRFVAVYYGENANRAGPVRSGRLFDAHLMRFYHGIFVFGWADDFVMQYLLQPDLKNSLLVERPDNCPPLCRIGLPNAYNNLYTDTSQIAEYLQDNRVNNDAPALSGLNFEQEPPQSGNPGTQLSINYSLVAYLRWQYDPAQGAYLREQDEQDAENGTRRYTPLIDSLTLEQISAANVVVLFVPHFYYRKSTSTDIIDQAMAGEGRGYAFRDGSIYPITWQADDPNALPRFYLPGGRPYPLKPGNTWFEIVGQTTGFEETTIGEWLFSFRTP